MPKGKYFLALDAGTGAGRCAIFDPSGRMAGRAYQEWRYYPLEGVPGACEFDPRDFWSTLAGLARQAISTSNITADEVAAVSCASQRQGMVLLDRQGREMQGIPNADRRASSEARQLREDWGKRFYGTAGRWPGDLHPASKLAWFKKHDPAALDRMSYFLTLSDWVAYRLTGEVASEPTGAAETCFMDVCEPAWWPGVAAEMGISPESLPPLRRAGEVLGGVQSDAAAQCGLRKGTPVVIAGADTQCGSLGAGATEQGQVAMIAGTSTPVHLVLAAPIFDILGRTLTNCHLVQKRWILESNALITGQTYRWLRDLCFPEQPASASYEMMDSEASRAPLGARGLLAFAGASVMDAAHGSLLPRGGIFFPLPLATAISRGCLARALLESHAFAVRANVEQLEEVSSLRFESILGAGQGSRSRLWTRMVASLTGLPVHLARESETTALGAAMCAAAGIGAYDSLASAAREMGKSGGQIDPDPSLAAAYEDIYQEWMKTYNRLKEAT